MRRQSQSPQWKNRFSWNEPLGYAKSARKIIIVQSIASTQKQLLPEAIYWLLKPIACKATLVL
jgi:hypothetical protein